jgi:hypothetical protein
MRSMFKQGYTMSFFIRWYKMNLVCILGDYCGIKIK